MIYRRITKTLLETLSYFPVLGLVGPRQVGKTTLARHLQSSLNKESVYVDIENPRDQSKLNDPVLFFERNQDKCVILDEIQRMPELFPALRSMIDENRIPARFIILGSASPDLIRDSSESLAGRIAYEELTPFNLIEIQTDNYFTHWLSGGFPSAFLAPNDNLRVKWISNFVKTYIERDLPLLGLNIDRNMLRKFWIMIAHIHGNVLNMQTLGRSLEVSSTTIKKYLAFLENTFLIRQLYPFSTNVKKRLVKSPKIYIRDSGVLHYLLDIPNFEALESNPILGASWEGYVIEQIFQQADEDTRLFFYKTHEGAECDLVLVKGDIVLCAIEIKYTSSPKVSKGMRNAFDDIKAADNYIVTPNTDHYYIEKDIQVINLQKFLKDNLRKG